MAMEHPRRERSAAVAATHQTVASGRCKRLPPFALRAISLALRFHLTRLSNSLGILGETLFSLVPIASGLRWLSTGLFPCGNGIVLNDQPPAHGQLWHWHTLFNCPCTRTARTHSCAIVPVAPVGCLAMVVMGQARPRSTGALIPILPPSSSSALGTNSPPRVSPPPFAWWQPFDCFGFHNATCSVGTVFDPSIGPKYPPCSKRES